MAPPPPRHPERKTLELGFRLMRITTVVQRPTELRSILLPVGWTLVRLTVGPQLCTASPAVKETALEEAERREARAHYVRWRLDSIVMVHVGVEITAEVSMPLAYAEATQW